jgi:hypothetical protein
MSQWLSMRLGSGWSNGTPVRGPSSQASFAKCISRANIRAFGKRMKSGYLSTSERGAHRGRCATRCTL